MRSNQVTTADASPDKAEQSNPKKRKRIYTPEEEEEWRRVVRRKIEEERRILDETENIDQPNKELYMLYNELQGIANEYDLDLTSTL